MSVMIEELKVQLLSKEGEYDLVKLSYPLVRETRMFVSLGAKSIVLKVRPDEMPAHPVGAETLHFNLGRELQNHLREVDVVCELAGALRDLMENPGIQLAGVESLRTFTRAKKALEAAGYGEGEEEPKPVQGELNQQLLEAVIEYCQDNCGVCSPAECSGCKTRAALKAAGLPVDQLPESEQED